MEGIYVVLPSYQECSLLSKNVYLFHILNVSSDEVTACKRILKNVQLEGYQVTITILFGNRRLAGQIIFF
jgi:hypothetical protein